MKSEAGGPATPDKRLAAVCGLFCPACSVYIASTQDPARLKVLAERFGVSEGEMECHGCRSEKRGLYCNNFCKMAGCARQKGVDFCGQCPEYPCAELKTFQGRMPHRIELWDSHERIKAAGWETWYREMVEHYSCRECAAINSAYDARCRGCGAVPSCAYMSLHEKDVAAHRGRMGPPESV